MAKTLATYIALPGTTADAFRHWHEVFGGELNLLTYGETQLEDMPFTPDPNAVAHVTLELPGGILAGGDQMPEEAPLPIESTSYSLLYSVDTPEEARELIGKLVDGGGEVNMPFEQVPWGDWYGQVFDRFRVMWAFNVPAAD